MSNNGNEINAIDNLMINGNKIDDELYLNYNGLIELIGVDKIELDKIELKLIECNKIELDKIEFVREEQSRSCLNDD